jgi:hypothetical protein
MLPATYALSYFKEPVTHLFEHMSCRRLKTECRPKATRRDDVFGAPVGELPCENVLGVSPGARNLCKLAS